MPPFRLQKGGPHEDRAPALWLDDHIQVEEDAAQGDVPFHTRHGAVDVATGEEGGMLVVIDHGEEEPDLAHDELLPASLPALLGELFNLRVLPGIQRERDEMEHLHR